MSKKQQVQPTKKPDRESATSRLKARVAELEARVEELTDDRDDFRRRLYLSEDEVRDLELEIDEMEQAIARLESDIERRINL